MKKIYTITGAVMLLFGILPFQLNPGTIPLLLGGAILLSSHYWSPSRRKKLMPFFVFCLVFALIFSGTLSYFAYGRQPDPAAEQTVVVLGCKVNGDRPSKMLKRRLDTAVEYLSENPQLNCVVTGGQGSNEDLPEAVAMKHYLVEQGIAEERIFAEPHSTDTKENLQFTKEIIETNGLSKHLTIISDGFHQCRARCIAAKLGLESSALSANTSFWLVPAYTVREALSFVKLLPFLFR